MTSKTAADQAAAAQADKPKREFVEVTLSKPHTHAGKPCQAKDKIKVTAAQKEWLVHQGKIEGQEVSNG